MATSAATLATIIGELSKKYKQKANFARCVPPKESKPKEGKASKA